MELIKKLIKAGRITIEQKIEGVERLRELRAEIDELEAQLDGVEVYVEEPADIDEQLKYDEATLKGMKEADIVKVAKSMGLEASVRDKKADTIAKILAAQ